MRTFFDDLITGLNEAIGIENGKLEDWKKFRGCTRQHR